MVTFLKIIKIITTVWVCAGLAMGTLAKHSSPDRFLREILNKASENSSTKLITYEY